jgi:peptidoglycan/LPS O-acetylase OafA/YrhL
LTADPTTDRRTLTYRPELDGIRAIGILLVLAQHINLPSSTLAGLVGVNLFFVLSGFLITSLLLREQDISGRIDIRNFYERRIRRLIPALVAVLIATGVLMVILGRFGDYPFQAVVSLFYASDIAKAMNLNLGYLGHTWSLALEEQFYLIWPALLIFLPRRFLAPLTIVGIVVAVALQFLLEPDNVLAHFRPDVRADAILWGCLIALVPVALPRWAAWVGLVGVIVLSFTPFWWPHAISVASGLSALVVAGAASLAPVLSNRPMVRIGQISYGMYLWHAIPVGIFEKETLAGNVLAMAAVVAITIAVSLASERWIEKPFRKQRRIPVANPAPDSPAPELIPIGR